MLALRRSPYRLWAAARCPNATSTISSISSGSSRTLTTTAPLHDEAVPATPAADVTAEKTASSIPAGTVLKNINYFQGREDPVALPDDQYPAWLWDTIKNKNAGAGEGGDAALLGDLYSKSRKARQLAAKAQRRLAALSGAEKQIPIDEQTLDVPYATSGQDGTIRRVVSASGIDGKTGTLEIGEGAREITAAEADAARDEIRRARRAKQRQAIKDANFLGRM